VDTGFTLLKLSQLFSFLSSFYWNGNEIMPVITGATGRRAHHDLLTRGVCAIPHTRSCRAWRVRHGVDSARLWLG